jgi:hypothetical protein
MALGRLAALMASRHGEERPVPNPGCGELAIVLPSRHHEIAVAILDMGKGRTDFSSVQRAPRAGPEGLP